MPFPSETVYGPLIRRADPKRPGHRSAYIDGIRYVLLTRTGNRWVATADPAFGGQSLGSDT